MGLSKGPSHDGRWKIVRKSLKGKKKKERKKKQGWFGFVLVGALVRCIKVYCVCMYTTFRLNECMYR